MTDCVVSSGGIRVASELIALPQSCVGVYVPIGSRHIPPRQLAALQEVCAGSHISVNASRDMLSLTQVTAPASSRTALHNISELIRYGSHGRDVKVSLQKNAPLSDPSVALSELLHAAAYGCRSPLGRFSSAAIDLRNASLDDKMKDASLALSAIRSCDSKDIVVSAAGSDVQVMVHEVDSELGDVFSKSSKKRICDDKTKYSGGKQLRFAEDWKPPLSGHRAHLAHVGLCFDCGFQLRHSASDKDLYAVLVANAMLGGGSAFSQGGPGKGMQSRLYTRVLSQPWAESARAMASFTRDNGLIGLVGACDPIAAGRMISSFAEQMILLAVEPITKDELERGQNAAANGIALAVENSNGLCEDMGTQMILRGHYDSPKKVVSAISTITATDVQRVVRRALNSNPSIAGIVPRNCCKSVVPVSILKKQIDMLMTLFTLRPSSNNNAKQVIPGIKKRS